MKTPTKNINEKFLLDLLERTDVVYFDTSERYFYFYPKNLGFTVQVPCSQYSKNVDINFAFDNSHSTSRYSDKSIVNFSFASAENIEEFMSQLYKKHENVLNNRMPQEEEKLMFLKCLKTALDEDSICKSEGQNESLKLMNKDGQNELIINIGKALYNYDSPIKRKPLEPIIIECFHITPNHSKNIYYQMAVPAYKIDEFPILSKLADVSPTTTDIHSLSDALNKANPEAGALLGSIILNLELDQKDEIKPNRLKL